MVTCGPVRRAWGTHCRILGLAALVCGGLGGLPGCMPAAPPLPKVPGGLASWYGRENGGRTASGEPYDPGALTAAHRTLPFGTLVRVIDRRTGASVIVRINDRGPWTGHRVLDLSSAAADRLGMKRKGVVPVDLEVVSLPPRKISSEKTP